MAEDDQGPERPQGELLGIPYDLRAPTPKRIKARVWNANDRRMFPPKVFGWGWSINFYWVVHIVKYVRQDRGNPSS